MAVDEAKAAYTQAVLTLSANSGPTQTGEKSVRRGTPFLRKHSDLALRIYIKLFYIDQCTSSWVT